MTDVRWKAIRVIDTAENLLRYHELINLARQQYNRYDGTNIEETVLLLLEGYLALAEPLIRELKENLEVLDQATEDLA